MRNQDNQVYWILLLFFLIVFCKIFISFFFPSPVIFGDESSYDQKAMGIAYDQNFFFKPQIVVDVLPGYPSVLSIGYLISSDKTIVYHIMLIINCLLTSILIFPSYKILLKYCQKREIALIGAVIVSTLPSVNSYSFLLMSENLFIPLFIFSIWFFIEMIDNPVDKKWVILFAISVIGLFLTRVMGIAMIFGAIIAIICYLFISLDNTKLSQILKIKLIYLLVLFFIIWIFFLYIMFLAQTNFFEISPQSYNLLTNADLSTTSLLFFEDLIHEIDYTIATTYFIFFLFYIGILFVAIKWIIFKGIFKNKTTLEDIHSNDEISLYLITLYVSISFVICLLLTNIHKISVQINEPNFFQIWGRLIDPIIPAIVLIGIIGLIFSFNKWNQLHNNKLLVVIFLITSIILISSFPYGQLVPIREHTSIYYMELLSPFTHQIFILLIFVFIALLYFYIPTHCKKILSIFLILFIIINILLMSVSYNYWFTNSAITNDEFGQMGLYLKNNLNIGDNVVLDKNDFDNGINKVPDLTFFLVTKFWINQDFLLNNVTTEKTNTNSATLISKGKHYIISSKLLSYYPLICVQQGYCLYTTIRDSYENIILMKNGWIGPYDTNTVPDWWISQDGADILIYQNTSQKQNISFEVNSFYRPRNLLIYKDGLLQMQVLAFPDKYTSILLPNIDSENTSILTFKVLDGCQKPCEITELNSKDCGCYGIRLRNIHFQT